MNSPIDSAYFDTEFIIHFEKHQTKSTIQIPLKPTKKSVDKFRLILKSIDKLAKPHELAYFCDILVKNELPTGLFGFEDTEKKVYQSDGFAEFLVNRYPPKNGKTMLNYSVKGKDFEYYDSFENVYDFDENDNEGILRIELCPDFRENIDQDHFEIVLEDVFNGEIDNDKKVLKVIVENDVGK